MQTTTYTVDHTIKTLAAISNKTGQIKVAPRFKQLSAEQQEFVIANIVLYRQLKSYNEADIQTVALLIQRYPGTNWLHWLKVYGAIAIAEEGHTNTLPMLQRMQYLREFYS